MCSVNEACTTRCLGFPSRHYLRVYGREECGRKASKKGSFAWLTRRASGNSRRNLRIDKRWRRVSDLCQCQTLSSRQVYVQEKGKGRGKERRNRQKNLPPPPLSPLPFPNLPVLQPSTPPSSSSSRVRVRERRRPSLTSFIFLFPFAS